MTLLKATALWLLYSLGAIALAHPDSNDTRLKSLTLSSSSKSGTKSLNRRQSDQCSGDCATCFGEGFQLCASSSSICYLPGDSIYGEDSCSGTSAIDVPSEPELCTDGGCAACFGSGFQDCPDSSVLCYKPGDINYGIESCSSSSSSDSNTPTTPSSTDSSFPTTDTCENGGLSCEYCFGEGHVACPQSDGYCYDPNNSTSICPGDAGAGSGSTSTDEELSSDSGSASAFSSASYTDVVSGASSQTVDSSEASATPASGASSTGGRGADTLSSATPTRSGGSSSATSGSNSNSNNQGSTSDNGSNGSPIQNSKGGSVVRAGPVGVLFASVVALIAALHLRI